MSRFFKTFLLAAGLFAFHSFSPAKADILDDMSSLIKTGNAKEIVANFVPEVELSILSQESISSKAQAETILQDFFSRHKPVSVKIIHKLTSNPNLLYAELVLNTTNGAFRTSFSIKKISGKFLVTAMTIEADKD